MEISVERRSACIDLISTASVVQTDTQVPISGEPDCQGLTVSSFGGGRVGYGRYSYASNLAFLHAGSGGKGKGHCFDG